MFNYSVSKTKYINDLEYKRCSLNKYHPYNEESKKELISFVKEKKKPCFMKYDVIKDDKENELLILRRRMPCVSVVEVLPATECFDIMLEAHLHENHGDSYLMAAILKSVYYVPPNIISIFLKACNVCDSLNRIAQIRKPKEVYVKYVPEFTVYCTIFQVQTNPDYGLSYIIVYVDALTNYVLLRPTYSKDHNAAAYELLKIFLDFGSPENILICDSDEYYKTLIMTLKSTDIFLNLPSISSRKNLLKLNWATENTSSLLQSWISTYKSSNWAIGLKEIQWQLNNTMNNNMKSRKLVNNETLLTPFHAHFGCFPNRNVIERTNKLGNTIQFHTTKLKTNIITIVGSCYKCGEVILDIYYKTCDACKQKCHFNCCVISVVELSLENHKLVVTCILCEELKNIKNDQVTINMVCE